VAVTRTGRYKIFPILGAVVTGLRLGLLSTMSAGTPVVVTCAYLMVIGIGLGLSMQILLLIVQNTFPAREVGTATASNNYFRQIGASLGAAVVGTLFASRLTDALGQDSGGSFDANALTPEAVRQLPPDVWDFVVTAYADSLTPVFGYLVPLLVFAAILLCFVIEKPLATRLEVAPPAAEGPLEMLHPVTDPARD
jgi:hypothetical protein